MTSAGNLSMREFNDLRRALGLPPGGRGPLLMGILNVTPDSFSDGGKYSTLEEAVKRGIGLLDQGAEILDIGGESTRPGAAEVSQDEEVGRVIPVIEAIIERRPTAVVSVDTSKSTVAEAALVSGAKVVNDVTSGSDPAMLESCAKAGSHVVLMHMRGSPGTMQQSPSYEDVVTEVAEYLSARVDSAVAAGIKRERILIDPGFGFGKLVEHNCRLVAELAKLAEIAPVLVGLSRKSTLGAITGSAVNDRLAESLAGALICALNGAAVVRVHDVAATRRALAVAVAMT